jgi:hypothetical protein
MLALDLIQTNSDDQVSQFSSLAQNILLCLKKENFNVKVSRYDVCENFMKLSEENKKLQLELLQQYSEVCEELQAQGESLCNSPMFVWKMMQKMGLKAKFDIFEHIGPTDIVEIYNHQNVQVYRNLFFFQICSYSFDELLSIPWWQLYRRSDEISQLIFANGSAIFRRDILEPIVPEIPEHLLEEIASEERLKMNLQIKLMAPLQNEAGEVYCLVVEKANLLSH